MQPQPITFSDFCQVVDLQFLTHIRRGTSISVCDFAPSSVPQDLAKALELLSVTSERRAPAKGQLLCYAVLCCATLRHTMP